MTPRRPTRQSSKDDDLEERDPLAQTATKYAFDERRLQRAGEHVQRHWFPVNASLFARVREGLTQGKYDLDVEFLLAELKGDFALFTYSLRELMHLIHDEDITVPAISSPLELMRWAGIERLKKILLRDISVISGHDLESMNEVQAARLKEAMISASTAEVIAEKDTIDPGFGYSVALLRQLGLTLIAWNYPTVYKRVFSSLKSDQTIDAELSKVLGFSPSLLALSLLKEWGVSMEVYEAVDDTPRERQQRLRTSQVADTLKKICKVGEALARANDPEHYPSAAADWEVARKELEVRFGFEGIRVIQDKMKENCENYTLTLERVLGGALIVDPEPRLHQFTETSLRHQNVNLKNCPPVVRKKLREWYGRLHPEQISRENVAYLVKEIVPFAGFVSGCIYVLDPTTMMLEPRVRIGRPELRDQRRISAHSEPALSCTSPLVENGESHGKPTYSGISAALGDENRIGVLYLECISSSLDDESVALLSVFRALRQAFMDCLNLQ